MWKLPVIAWSVTLPVLALVACTSQQMQTASTTATAAAPIAAQVAEATLPAPALADLQKACVAFQAVAAGGSALASGGAAQTVANVANPGKAFCSIVSNGSVPQNADANSINWLQVLMTTISTVKALSA